MRIVCCALIAAGLIGTTPLLFVPIVVHAQTSDSDNDGNSDPDSAFGAVEAVEGSGNVDAAQRDPDQAVRSGPSRRRQVHPGARTYDPNSFLPLANERREAESSASSRAAAASTVVQQSPQRVEGWRYTWYKGHWWYYQRNKKWLFWNGGSWTTYSPQRYSRSYTRPARNPYDYDAYAPYNTDAPPGARIGAAIIGGSSGPEAARAARVGENN